MPTQIHLGHRDDLQALPFSPLYPVKELIKLRFHTLSSSIGPRQNPDLPRLHRTAIVGIDRTTDHWNHIGLVDAEMGSKTTVYDGWLVDGGGVLPYDGVGIGDCGTGDNE